MLTLIIGRAGTGKTTELLHRLCAGAAAGRKQICLVPEQYSHEMTRRLCDAGGAGISLHAEVLSFTNLSNRVFAEAGGLSTPQLDSGGRLLLLHEALHSIESQLTVYSRPSRKASFLNSLMSTIDELKRECIRPEQLFRAAERQPEDADKLRDLGLIYGTYEAFTEQRAADPRDRLTRLESALQKYPYFVNTDVYVDCFETFTAQEEQILYRILQQADSMTVAVTCGDWDEKSIHLEFEPARSTIHHLAERARSAGVEVRTESWTRPRESWVPELNWLENAWCRNVEAWAEPTAAVELCTAESPFEEVEYAAGKILELVRERGWRWRDIGVTVRNMGGWEDEIEAVFRRYGIPVTLNRMTDILQKPVLTLVTSALNAVNGNFRYDDMFRYLKTGLAGVGPEERDQLENYVLMWDIKGTKWTTDTPWSWNPDGFAQEWTEEGKARVKELDELRRRIIAPLVHLKKSKGSTGLDRAQAVYAFLEEIDLRGQLEDRAKLYTEKGELNQAEEYSQLWEILCGALEQCAQLLNKEQLSLSEFSQLFQLVLSQYDVGSIPVSLDRVTVGEARRMPHSRLKCLIILGAEEDSFPHVSEPEGLLTDEDREILSSSLDQPMSGSTEDNAKLELSLLYSLVSLPTDILAVCHSTRSATGDEQRPSFLFNRLSLCFPGCSRVRADRKRRQYRLSSPIPALDELAETRSPALQKALEALPAASDRAARLERSFRAERGSLSPEAVDDLYSRTIRLSASKMNKLKQCHFSYFMEYGLDLKPRKTATFDAAAIGTFVHYVLEHMLKAAGERGGVKQCDDETIRALTRQAEEDYIHEKLDGLEDKDMRFRYLFRRQQLSVDQIVSNVVQELRCSDFEPISFELGFGRKGNTPIRRQVGKLTLSITGYVDRVDGWRRDGKLYYRIIDYKTGSKKFDYTNIWNGLDLQMLIYLFALKDDGRINPDSGGSVPAGVLYLPARQVIVQGERDMDQEVLQEAVDSGLKRSGLLLNDMDVLNAMEHREENEIAFHFLPVKVTESKKNGVTMCKDFLATPEQLDELQHHINRILDDIGQEFLSGNVDADPYYHGDSTACRYCDYAAACQFEEGRKGNRRRYIPTVKPEDFWTKLDEEEKNRKS